MVAHRLSTIMNMDLILAFDNGNVIEDGIYEELLYQNGLFKKMWDARTAGLLPAKKEKHLTTRYAKKLDYIYFHATSYECNCVI